MPDDLTDKRQSQSRRNPRKQVAQSEWAVHHLTQAMENYLLSIYVVGEQGLRVTNQNLVEQLRRVPATEHLGTSLPSVSGMLRRMQSEQLISIGEGKDIALTTQGTKLAESIIRRHRLAGKMIVELLGVPLHEVNAEAHRLEHAMSDSLESRIQERLGHPKTDPFGQPIPGSGYVASDGIVTLDNAAPGSFCTVDRIPEDDVELVRYLQDCGLLPGVRIAVEEVAPYRGIVTVKVGPRSAVLGHSVAARIRVKPE